MSHDNQSMNVRNSTYSHHLLLNRATASSLKIGLFGIGLDAYWPQFEGLKERLEQNMAVVEEKLSTVHANIVNAGLVDTVDKAFEDL